MNCDFKTIRCGVSRQKRAGFTLIEAVTALGVLAVIVTGVLVTVNRSVEAMVDNRSRVLAFELARENMERLLGEDSVTDTSEFGVHELDEDIEWENKVESFNEPVNSAMWIRAVCSASYTDRDGQRQKVELTHWITDVTKTQEKQILDQKRREQEFMEEMDGNPFGDDPDGLMQYADALAEMGDYERAAETASNLILDYPGEPQAATAWSDLLGYPELALAQGDAIAAGTILEIIIENHGDRPEAQRTYDKVKPIIDSGQAFAPRAGDRTRTSGGLSGDGSTSAGGSAVGRPDGSGGTTSGSVNNQVNPGGGGESVRSGAGKTTGASGKAPSGGNKGSGGAPSSSGGTGSGNTSSNGSKYPNQGWSAEQKRIWDMFMGLPQSGQE